MRAVKTVISAAGNLKREKADMDEVNIFLNNALYVFIYFPAFLCSQKVSEMPVLSEICHIV